MDKRIIAFIDTEIEKHKFHFNKNPISIDHVDFDEILLYAARFILVKRVLNILLFAKRMKI